MKGLNENQNLAGPEKWAHEKKDNDPNYWYVDSAAIPIFNAESRCKRQSVIYSIFARLFLAPMMLPHHQKSKSDQAIWEKQVQFITEYETAIELLEKDVNKNLPSDTSGRRAQEMVDFLGREGHAPSLTQEQSNNYSSKTSSYKTPRRYIAFYQWTRNYNASRLPEYIQRVEALYTRQLMLLFQKDLAGLARRLRYLISNLPEKGRFLLEDSAAPDEKILSLAGRILSCTLLASAAEKSRNGEVYEMLHQHFGMPMPESFTETNTFSFFSILNNNTWIIPSELSQAGENDHFTHKCLGYYRIETGGARNPCAPHSSTVRRNAECGLYNRQLYANNTTAKNAHIDGSTVVTFDRICIN